jgi:zinc/manganese transport system permease protein
VSFDATALTIILPGLVAGILVLATHVPLGREVLKRGIIFIDLAVAQMAGLGVIAAGTFGLDAHGIAAQAAAFAAALLGGLLLSWTDKRFGKTQEAIIGVSFVLAATGGLLLLANNPHGGEELRDLLVGQILFADVHTLTPAAVLAAVVLASWRLVMRTFGRPGFYLLFAVSVTASVQLVGVYLVFASLMVPALATRSLNVHALAAGYAIGLLGYLAGLLLSAVYDLPTGAVIVWTLTLAGLVAAPLLGRWRGAAA